MKMNGETKKKEKKRNCDGNGETLKSDQANISEVTQKSCAVVFVFTVQHVIPQQVHLLNYRFVMTDGKNMNKIT